MLQADPIVRSIIDFLDGCATIEHTLGLALNRLRKMPQTIPLATLFYSGVSPGGWYRGRKEE